jgi:hypothetical protein
MCNSYESRSVSARAESYKKVRKQIKKKNFLTSPCFFGIRDPGWEKIRIRDKHPGSATLIVKGFIIKNIQTINRNPALTLSAELHFKILKNSGSGQTERIFSSKVSEEHYIDNKK